MMKCKVIEPTLATDDQSQALTHGDHRPEENDPCQVTSPNPCGLAASQLAHDLRSFLTAICTVAQGVRQSASPDSTIAQQIAMLDESVKHAGEICEQLQLALAGFEAGECVEQPLQAIDLSELVDGMKGLLDTMTRPGTVVNTELAHALSPIVANPTHLHRVVLALLTNAFEAMDSGGGSIAIRTGVSDWPVWLRASGDAGSNSYRLTHNDWVFLEVRDTGCGINRDNLQKIFDPFFTTKKDGHGLGLASVMRIVQGYGGVVSVESRPGMGTTFRCTFPAATSRQLERLRPTTVKFAPSEPFSDPVNVLLIDDNEAVRYGSKLALESSGKGRFHVITASEGEEAITLLRQPHNFSVAVLDLHLPDCEGTGLFSTMRTLAPQLPVIVVSGIPEQQLVARFSHHRPDGFLVKPFDGDTLIQQIFAVMHGEKPTAV